VDARFGHVDARPRLVERHPQGVEDSLGGVDVHPRLPIDVAGDKFDQIYDPISVILVATR
jgi:hypothetical protein